MSDKRNLNLAKTINLGMKEEGQGKPGASGVIEVAPGQILAGRYKVDKKLGEGGMGIVYKGFDQQLNQPVAIKLLKKHMSQNVQAVTKMKEEAQVAMMLSHPNIMRLINFERHDQYAYLLLEFIEGKDLEILMEERTDGRYDAATLAQIAMKICDGLAYAHTNNVIHRDIKPANIMICNLGEVKLMDFGIAKMLADQDGERASISGTLAYIAPEIFDGVRPDPRVDIYALGLTVYELLAGTHPFSVKGKTTLQVIEQHQKLQPPDIEGVDRGMMNIVRTAIEKRPNARYQTAQSMRNAFSRFLNLDEKANMERMKRKMEYEMRQLEQEKKKLEQEKLRMKGGGRGRARRPSDTQRIGANARAKAMKKGGGRRQSNKETLKPFSEFEAPPINELALTMAVSVGFGLIGALVKMIVESSEVGYVGGAGMVGALLIVAIMVAGPIYVKDGAKLAILAGGIGMGCALVAYIIGKPHIHFAFDNQEWSSYNYLIYLTLAIPAAIAASLFHIGDRDFGASMSVLAGSVIVVAITAQLSLIDLENISPELSEFQDFIFLPILAVALWWVVGFFEKNISEI